MAKGCKKCDPHELCEECPEWIFTLADLIMCMMGLFVLLWVLKPSPNPNQGLSVNDDLTKVMAAIRESLGYIPDPTSTEAVDLKILMNKLEKMKPHNSEGEGGETRIKRTGAEGSDPEVTSIRPGNYASTGGKMTFAKGEAGLSNEMKDDLNQLAKLIRGHRNVVVIKGHTSLDDFGDDITAERKMDLSLKRAQAVADYLASVNVERDILRVQGCSTFEPIKQFEYKENTQQFNRRVEVEVTSTLVPELQDTSKRSRSESLPSIPVPEAGNAISPPH